jgi:hypothetical protein
MPLFYDPTVGLTRTQLKAAPVTYSTGLKEKIASLQTTDATSTVIWTLSNILEGTTVWIDCKICAQETSDAERAGYQVSGLFYRPAAGAVTQQGSTVSKFTIESDANYDVEFNISSPDLELKVTGAAGDTTNWVAIIQYFIVTDS